MSVSWMLALVSSTKVILGARRLDTIVSPTRGERCRVEVCECCMLMYSIGGAADAGSARS